MNTNATNNSKLFYPKLSYTITGICFAVHNTLGRYAREKQYGDALECELKKQNLNYIREWNIVNTGNRADFLLENKIILEIKSKKMVLKEDYYQIQRYLQSTKLQLGLLVNFRQRYLKPQRIIRIDTDVREKFV